MFINQTYSGPGSIDEPEFPLLYIKPSGAHVVCQNKQEMLDQIEDDLNSESIFLIIAGVGIASLIAGMVIMLL